MPIIIPVSKQNYNRIKCRTHTMSQVLKNAGYKVDRAFSNDQGIKFVTYLVWYQGAATPINRFRVVPEAFRATCTKAEL